MATCSLFALLETEPTRPHHLLELPGHRHRDGEFYPRRVASRMASEGQAWGAQEVLPRFDVPAECS